MAAYSLHRGNCHSPASRGSWLNSTGDVLLAVILDYDIGALSPSVPIWYMQLGRELWRGALLIRSSSGIIPSPDEHVTVLRLPRTPELDLNATISADWRPYEVW